MKSRLAMGLMVGGVVGFASIAALYLLPGVGTREGPEEVSEAFYIATYTHSFSSAWDRVSSEDQSVRTREQYLAENPLPNKLQTELLNQLASWGEFETVAITSTSPSRAFVSAHIRFPHSGQIEIQELLAKAGEPDADRSILLAKLNALNDSAELHFVDGDIGFDLVSEGNRWRIAQHWGQSITVHLNAAVSPDLSWDFYPISREISALPGELASASYMARNNSEQTITAKAIHEVGPPESASYFQTIECFCFREQTLDPGEEREMVFLFRIDLLAPHGLTDLDNLYTFYSLDTFPSES
ncbi:MAG: cytochrome c oxidase assembly protein [Anaerolineales bacterium]